MPATSASLFSGTAAYYDRFRAPYAQAAIDFKWLVQQPFLVAVVHLSTAIKFAPLSFIIPRSHSHNQRSHCSATIS
jgi:hypothetical protein